MTKFYLFLVLLIVSNTFAQEKTYTFSKNRLQQVRKFSYNINPLKLKQTSIKIARFDTVKTVTKEYAVILAENEEFKKDSINAKQNNKPWDREKQFSKVKYYKLDPNPKKYDLKYNFRDSVLVAGFESVEFDYLTLNGSFMKIEKYYQKNNNIILLEENIKNINFKLNNFYEMNNTGRTLLQNTETKEYILVSGSLLSEYENTKNEEDLKEFNDGYLIWKTKYTELTKSAENNIKICNSILKRNTFINVLGQSVWNADKISKKDKIEFNNNYDAITEKLSKLGVLEQERKFYSYYLDNVKGDEGLNVYGISIFHSTAQKFTIK
ncbi:hypothetical protein ACUXZJ_14385 [Flavobacterium sp. TN-1]